jgi:hypothetical protein
MGWEDSWWHDRPRSDIPSWGQYRIGKKPIKRHLRTIRLESRVKMLY